MVGGCALRVESKLLQVYPHARGTAEYAMATALQQRLLHMSAAGIGRTEDVADLAASDWAKLLVMARRHGLGCVAALAARARPGGGGVPKPFAEALAAGFEKHSRRAVEPRAEVSRIQRIMRDLDVLVPEEQAQVCARIAKDERPGAWPMFYSVRRYCWLSQSAGGSWLSPGRLAPGRPPGRNFSSTCSSFSLSMGLAR